MWRNGELSSGRKESFNKLSTKLQAAFKMYTPPKILGIISAPWLLRIWTSEAFSSTLNPWIIQMEAHFLLDFL